MLGLSALPERGVPEAAEVKKAYRQLCLQFHPDKHATSLPETQLRAKNRFGRIQAAYEKLLPSNNPLPSYRSGYGSAGGYGF